jgi:elongation factor G
VAGRFVPLLCGAALRNKGVPQVLDAICDWLPSPLDVPPPEGLVARTGEHVTVAPDEQGAPLALAFKVSLLDEQRRFVFLRLYAGRIAEGDEVWNATQGRPERISRVLLMHAAEKRRVPALAAGQIFAVMGLKEARTGDTLSSRLHPIVLRGLPDYRPVLSQAVEPQATADREPLLSALARMADEDPSLRFGEDPDTGQLLLSGQGELHLEVVVERLRREFKVGVRTGTPQVLLRETVTATAEAEATFERATDELRLFARARVRVAPRPRGAGFAFAVDGAVATASLREEAREALESGAREAAEAGVLEGHPLQDVEVTLLDLGLREGESRPQALKVAVAEAVRAAAGRAAPVLLEPVMRLEVVAPAEHLGDVLGSLDRRRGAVLEVEERGTAARAVAAEAPLRRLFGYATELRSLSQGRAAFTMRFDRYDVPA